MEVPVPRNEITVFPSPIVASEVTYNGFRYCSLIHTKISLVASQYCRSSSPYCFAYPCPMWNLLRMEQISAPLFPVLTSASLPSDAPASHRKPGRPPGSVRPHLSIIPVLPTRSERSLSHRLHRQTENIPHLPPSLPAGSDLTSLFRKAVYSCSTAAASST